MRVLVVIFSVRCSDSSLMKYSSKRSIWLFYSRHFSTVNDKSLTLVMKGTSLSTFFLHLRVSTGSVGSIPIAHPKINIYSYLLLGAAFLYQHWQHVLYLRCVLLFKWCCLGLWSLGYGLDKSRKAGQKGKIQNALFQNLWNSG